VKRLMVMIAAVVFSWLVLLSPAYAQTFTNPPSVEDAVIWAEPPSIASWSRYRGVAAEIVGPSSDAVLLERIRKHADSALPRLARDLGVPLGEAFTVYVVPTQEAFVTLQPGQPPGWADATAYPAYGAVFLRNPSIRGGQARPIEQVLEHELVHVLLGRVFSPRRVPHWLQEGLAQVHSGEAGPDLPARIAQGAFGRGTLSLTSLSQGFPSDARRADLAYAQSADLILWLEETYGRSTVRRLIRQMAAGRSVEGALHDLTGKNMLELDAAWRARLAPSTWRFTDPVQWETGLFAGVGLLLGVVGWRRRRAFKQRLVRWREDEFQLRALARDILRRRAGRGQLPSAPPGEGRAPWDGRLR